MVHAIFRDKRAKRMITGKDFRGAIGCVRAIDSNNGGDKATWERFPPDVILMHGVTLRARRFEDEFVLKKMRTLAIEVGHQGDEPWISGDASAYGADIDHRVKAIEAAFAAGDTVLPSA